MIVSQSKKICVGLQQINIPLNDDLMDLVKNDLKNG